MLAINADVGLVVTSSAIRILRQTFRVSSAVEIVGEFPLSLAPGIEQTSDPIAFEDQVQRWLEALRDRRQHVAEPLLSALDEHVVPSLIDGDIRAAHPRLRYAVG